MPQEARADLKGRLMNQDGDDASRPAKAVERPDPRRMIRDKTDETKRSSRASKSSRACEGSQAGDESSSHMDLDPDEFVSRDSEDDDDDHDVFRNQFALAKVRKPEQDTKEDRLGNLPRKLAKHLEGFESSVLESIPIGLNETPGSRLRLVMCTTAGSVMLCCSPYLATCEVGFQEVLHDTRARGALDDDQCQGDMLRVS